MQDVIFGEALGINPPGMTVCKEFRRKGMSYHGLAGTRHKRVLSPLSPGAVHSPHSQPTWLELEEKIPGFSMAVVFPSERRVPGRAGQGYTHSG